MEEFLILGFARAVRTWMFGTLFLNDFLSGSFFLGVWVLHVGYGTLDSSGDDFVCAVQCLARRWLHVLHQYLAFGRIAHIFYVAVDSNSEVFGLFRTQNEEECSVDASVSVLDALLAPGNLEILS